MYFAEEALLPKDIFDLIRRAVRCKERKALRSSKDMCYRGVCSDVHYAAVRIGSFIKPVWESGGNAEKWTSANTE